MVWVNKIVFGKRSNLYSIVGGGVKRFLDEEESCLVVGRGKIFQFKK